MNEHTLHELAADTVLVVPTGSLSTHLTEAHAAQQVEQGKQAWEAPNIVLWQELLRFFWQQNRAQMQPFHTVLTAQQAKLLWTQVVEQSKSSSSALTLLNVQQTVRACMRSHRLLSDWQCNEAALEHEHIGDVNQFLSWRGAYQTALTQRHVTDEPGLQHEVLQHVSKGEIEWPFQRVIWYAYDLITAAQSTFNQHLEQKGAECLIAGPQRTEDTDTHYHRYDTQAQELETVFLRARQQLEDDPESTVSIVVPDLQHRYAQVQELARHTFYPNALLTEAQNNNLIYRFSLGKPLHEWPAITAALSALNLLKSRVAVADLSFLLRSVYLPAIQTHKTRFNDFERWLQRQRLKYIEFERLPDYIADFMSDESDKADNISSHDGTHYAALGELVSTLLEFKHELQQRLEQAKQKTGYQSLPFHDWAILFSDWLGLWQWQTNRAGSELSSVAHQLRGRWVSTLEQFASLGAVQRSIGLNNALTAFQHLVRDTVFLPKSAVSPIMVSGLFEALGRETDVCFLTGMTQDFPPASRSDAFIPNHHLLPTGYPDASPQRSVRQAAKVVQSLLSAAHKSHVSFATHSTSEQDIDTQASPLFLTQLNAAPTHVQTQPPSSNYRLQNYTDTIGPAWQSPEKVRGGSAIFKDQSQCAFKAFTTHQLRFKVDEEPEFGLDQRDRGQLTHDMLERVWGLLPSQSALQALEEDQQAELLEATFEQLLSNSTDYLSDDKRRLLALEKARIIALTNEWLNQERKRPTDFSVVERESRYQGQWAGIRFDYIIDRMDLTEAGQSVVVDYKTGSVSRANWLGERPKEPQLPLYALALDELKSTGISGIAFAQIRRGDCKFVELADTDIFLKATKTTEAREQEWQERRADWPALFTRLAQDFLAGKADVNPVDKSVCQYCELTAVCRVQELREHTRRLPQQNSAEQA